MAFNDRFSGAPSILDFLAARLPVMPENMVQSAPSMTQAPIPAQIDPTPTASIPQQVAPQPQMPIQVPQGDLNYFPPQPDANRAPVTDRPFSMPQQNAPQQSAQGQQGGSGGNGLETFAAFLQGLGRGNGLLSAIGGGLGAVQDQKRENQTVKYLTARGIPQGEAELLAQSPQATFQVLQNLRKGADPKTALELQKLGYEVDAARLKAQGGLDTKDRYMAVGKKVFDRQTGQLVDLPSSAGDSDTEYGLNPIWGQDEAGNPVLGVLGKDGTFKKVNTGGFDISTGTEQIDLGDSFALKDKRSGQIIGTVPKNLANAEKEKAVGKAQGEAASSYTSMKSKLPGLEKVVSDLDKLADEATYTTAGQAVDWARRQAGMAPRNSALARTKYIAMVDNQVLPLLRETFGAAFTLKEGETLRATLGDPDKTPAEKKAVLEAFIAQKKRDVEALGTAGGVTGDAGSTSGVVDFSDFFKQ
ncbi:hypothetical protein ACLBWS_05715 [Brucellaceae bacterium D45D]